MRVGTPFSKIMLLVALGVISINTFLATRSYEGPQIPLEDIVAQGGSPFNLSIIDNKSISTNANDTTVSNPSLSSLSSTTSNENTSQQSGRIHMPHPQLGRPVVGTENFSRFQNETYKMSIYHPNNWHKVQSVNNISFISPPEGNQDSYQERLVIDIFPSGNIPLSERVSVDIIEYRQNVSNFTLIDSVSEALAGNTPAHSIVYTYEKGQDLYKVMEKWLSLHGKTYSLKYIAEPEKYENYLPVINQILNSLTIEPEPRPKPTKNPELYISVEPYDVAVNPITNMLYVSNPRFHTVSVIDGSTDRPVSNIKVQNFPLSVAVDEEMNTIFVANSRSNTVSVIDGTTNRLMSNIEVGRKPVAIALDNDEVGLDSLMFVVNSDSNTISVIDTTNNTLKGTITVGKGPGPLVVNSIINRLYVANADSNTVSIVDYYVSEGGGFESTKVSEDIRVGNYPTSIALDSRRNKIYVANSDSNTISVINGQTNRLEGNDIAVEARPYGMLYYKERLYVANFGSNTIAVIDVSQRKTINTIPVGGLPIGLAFNPVTQVIYVTNLGSKTVSEIKDTSVLAGISFNVNPSNAGHIECGRNVISSIEYTRYPSDQDIICKAYPGTNSLFESWTSDLPLVSGSTNDTIKFKPSRYSNLTANFQVLQELQLPRQYTEQLYSVMSTLMIPIIVSVIGGWSIPAVAKWINGKRQRGYLRRSMKTIAMIRETQYQNKENYLKRFEDVRRKADDLLTDGKITEEHYGILNTKISEYEEDIDRLFHE